MSATGTTATRATFGAAFILLAWSANLADRVPLSSRALPIAVWGYLLLIDALVEWRTGRSFFAQDPPRFLGWTALSLLFCRVGEIYGLCLFDREAGAAPADRAIALAVAAASLAALLPAVFLTSAGLAGLGVFGGLRRRPWRPPEPWLYRSTIAGLLCLTLPLLWSREAISRFLALPAAGFLLLLEPVNRRLGAPSILADLAHGEPGRALRLILAGYLCGALVAWWYGPAAVRWPGLLAAGPVALDLYAMYNLCLGLWRNARGRAVGIDPPGAISL